MSIELKIMCGVGVLDIVAVLIFALLTHPDNIDKPWRQPMKLWLRNVGIGILLGVVFGMLLGSVRSAKAHDNPDNWIGQERRKNAGPAIAERHADIIAQHEPFPSCPSPI